MNASKGKIVTVIASALCIVFMFIGWISIGAEGMEMSMSMLDIADYGEMFSGVAGGLSGLGGMSDDYGMLDSLETGITLIKYGAYAIIALFAVLIILELMNKEAKKIVSVISAVVSCGYTIYILSAMSDLEDVTGLLGGMGGVEIETSIVPYLLIVASIVALIGAFMKETPSVNGGTFNTPSYTPTYNENINTPSNNVAQPVQNNGVKFCTNCGAKMELEKNFCTFCGNRLN